MTDYKPISCANYDRFEIAIMHRESLRLIWNEENVVYDRVVTPVNLQTESGAEFLVVRGEDGMQRIRLDHIRKVSAA